MLFNSLDFAVFLALVLALTLVLGHRAQNRFLLVASYAFYAAWDWRFLALIAISTAVDFTVGLRLERTDEPGRRKALAAASLTVNLGILGFFKYAGFFAESLAELAGVFGVTLSAFTLDVVLPVGISFYTFQTLSYTLDVYRRQVPATHDLLDFALYVAFFPQLVAGPIERATRLLPQVQAPRTVGVASVVSGGWLVFWGLFKKVVIADNLAPLVDAVYAPGATVSGPEVLLATYAFAFQIYCDFSGYTDIARGVARMLGFDLMRNFDLPYLASSVTDFWRRWHVSLSTWLRDYLYIPLGGNRKGASRTRVNLMLTMLLGGLWHGAAWTFVIWGAYHGALLVLHRALSPLLARLGDGRPVRVLRVAVVFHLVCLGWVFFRAEDLPHALSLLGALVVGPWSAGVAGQWMLPLAVLLAPLLVLQAFEAWTGDRAPVMRLPVAARSLVYVVMFTAFVLLGEDGGQPFVYFQF